VQAYFERARNYDRDIRLYFLYSFLANISVGVFALVFNLYLVQINLREDFIGYFNALQTAAMAITAVLMTRVITRVGIWKVVTTGLVIYSTLSMLMIFITNQAALLVLSFVFGAAFALVFIQVMPFVVELTRPRERQEVATIVMSLLSIATTVGSLVGGWTPRLFASVLGFEVASAENYRAVMVSGVVIGLSAIAPLMLMSRERKDAVPAQMDTSEEAGRRAAPERVARKHVFVFVTVGALMGIGSATVMPFFNVYMASIGASTGQIGIVFAAGWTVAAVVGLAAPYLSRRYGAQRASALIRVAPMPLFLLLIPFPVLWIAAAAYLVRVTSISLSWPIESTYISEILPGKARYTVFGYRSAAWNIVWAVTSFAAGNLIVRYGYTFAFIVFAVFMFASMGLFYAYFGRIAPAATVEEDTADGTSAPVRTISESEAPESLNLQPGRGKPLIVVSDDTASAGHDGEARRED
jgi:MFS family permease